MKTILALWACTAAITAAPAAEPPWRSLFNGRDLTGWKIGSREPKARTWVEDGALVGHMVRGTPEHSFLCTEEKFDGYGRNWLWLQTLEYDERARSACRFNEWAHFRIEAIGRSLKVWVHGLPTAHLGHDKYARGYVALKIHSFSAKGDPEQEKNLIRFRNSRVITDSPARFARPIDLPARTADPSQKILPKP
jgi:hypothetical protein